MEITVTKSVGGSPSSCTFTVGKGETKPLVGQRVVIDVGGPQLFSGTVVRVDQRYEERKDLWVWDVTLMDEVWQLNARRPFGGWAGISATTVVTEMVAAFAPAFNVTNVQASLPFVTIECDGREDFAACLSRICEFIGAVWFTEGLNLFLFITPPAPTPDELNNTTNTTLLHDPAQLTSTEDGTQQRTRALVYGATAHTVMAHIPGDIFLDVNVFDMFSSTGGWVIVGSQRVRYTSKTQVTLTDAEAAATRTSGQLPSGAGAVGIFVGPGRGMTVTPKTDTYGVYGRGYYGFYSTFIYANGKESDYGPVSLVYLPSNVAFQFNNIPVGQPVSGVPVVARKLYFFFNDDQSTVYPFTVIPDNTTTSGVFTRTYNGGPVAMGVGASPPGPSMPPTAVLSSTNNNATNPPGVDTYGLSTGAFVYSWVYEDGTESFPSAPSIPVIFSGNKAIDFSNLQWGPPINGVNVAFLKLFLENSEAGYILWGIVVGGLTVTSATVGLNSAWSFQSGKKPISPETGSGSVGHSSVHYFLTGIPAAGDGAIVRPIIPGTAARIFVTVDDVLAQAELAIREGGDGIREVTIEGDYPSDNAARIAGLAHLSLFSRPALSCSFSTVDTKVGLGKEVVANLTDPPLVGTMRIESINIISIHEADFRNAVYQVRASTASFLTFEGLIRKMTLK